MAMQHELSRRGLLRAGLSLAGVSLLAACCFTLFGQANQPGRRVFESNCAMCHGSDANGGEFAPGIVTPGGERLTELDGYPLELTADGVLLFLRYVDRPGVVGTVGTIMRS